MKYRDDLDYDLQACLEYNPQDGYTAEDIRTVLAVWEGERDGDDWRWIIELKDGQFVFIRGGCGYTGWDCQSAASSVFADEPAALLVEENVPEVRASLESQLTGGKSTTWRETKNEEFNVTARSFVDATWRAILNSAPKAFTGEYVPEDDTWLETNQPFDE